MHGRDMCNIGALRTGRSELAFSHSPIGAVVRAMREKEAGR